MVQIPSLVPKFVFDPRQKKGHRQTIPPLPDDKSQYLTERHAQHGPVHRQTANLKANLQFFRSFDAGRVGPYIGAFGTSAAIQ